MSKPTPKVVACCAATLVTAGSVNALICSGSRRFNNVGVTILFGTVALTLSHFLGEFIFKTVFRRGNFGKDFDAIDESDI